MLSPGAPETSSMNRLARALSALGKLSRKEVVVVCVVLVLGVGACEYLAPDEYSFELFYLLPLAFAAWYGGERLGIALAILAAFGPELAVLMQHSPDRQIVAIWNAAMRVGVFGVTAALIHRLRLALDRMKVLVGTDDLTGAANARTFHERCRLEMTRARRHGTPLTLLYLDLDNFKEVNDEIGHLAGDAVLKLVVDTIRENCRPYDLIARMGGDEFAVLFSDIDDRFAAAIRERVREVVAHTMRRRGFPVTCSIGSVTFRTIPADPDDLIRTADEAMSEAKRRGKNMVVHRDA
jgi:diguanylate cyclase (GGDEF)-like protein